MDFSVILFVETILCFMNKHNIKSGFLFATSTPFAVVFTVVFLSGFFAATVKAETATTTPSSSGDGGGGNSTNHPPTLSELGQFDGATSIPEGWVLRHPYISSFSANVSDPDGDQVKLQMEFRRFEEPFTGIDDGGILTSDLVDPVPSGWNARVPEMQLSCGCRPAIHLSDGKYHWRARAIDTVGNVSEWQEFGVVGNVDFEILTNKLPSFSFPIKGFSPYTAPVGSILDHSGNLNCNKPKTCDGLVKTFDGEVGLKEFGQNASPPGYVKDANGTSFFKDSFTQTFQNNIIQEHLNYVGSGSEQCFDKDGNLMECFSPKAYLNYDGHSGYDFVIPRRVNILAAADGYLEKVECGGDLINGCGFNALKIVHANGYETWYLHAIIGSEIVSTGEKKWVNMGDKIAEVGNTGVVAYHLHFEVRHSGNIVDPYDINQTLWSFISSNYIAGQIHSPGELRVYDSEGRVTGLVNGVEKNEIPESEYGNEGFVIYNPSGEYRYEIVGTEDGMYSLDIVSASESNYTKFEATDIQIQSNEIHQYEIDWNSLSQNEKGVTLQIDKSGDGTVDDTVQVGANFSDNIPPIATPVIDGTFGQDDWYMSDVTFALDVIDNTGGVGVESIKYSLDDGTWQTFSSTLPINIKTEGIHTLQYYSTDFFGNQETINTAIIKIDKTPPEAVIQFDPKSSDLKFTGTDNLTAMTDANVNDNDDNITMTDEAGNQTIIKLKDKDRKKTLKVEIQSIFYNGEPVDISKNKLQFFWSYDKNKDLGILSQHIQSKNGYNILAVYDVEKTRLSGKDTFGIISGIRPGLVLLKITTNKGNFSWGF